MFLICSELGKTPDELRGLTDGQTDWLYYNIIEKYRREAEVLQGTQSALVFEGK